jgi:hypothetical protein
VTQPASLLEAGGALLELADADAPDGTMFILHQAK